MPTHPKQEFKIGRYLGMSETEIPNMTFTESCVSPEVNAIQSNLRQKFVGCFLGLAIGDAKGMPAESKSKSRAAKVANTFKYLDGYLAAGSYTDDTNHAILLAESLIEANGFDSNTFMSNMLNMDLERGYGPTTLKSITKYIHTNSAKESGHASSSDGPAMRVAPLALLYYYDYKLLKKKVIESTICTHTSTEAIGGTLAVAFSIAYMLKNHDKALDIEKYRKDLIRFVRPISSQVAKSFKNDAQLMERIGCRVLEAVPHSVKSFVENKDNFENTINESIRGAGDADTIAAMAGAISGALNGVIGIPQAWIDGIENEEKGKDYIVALANKLFEISQQLRKS